MVVDVTTVLLRGVAAPAGTAVEVEVRGTRQEPQGASALDGCSASSVLTWYFLMSILGGSPLEIFMLETLAASEPHLARAVASAWTDLTLWALGVRFCVHPT